MQLLPLVCALAAAASLVPKARAAAPPANVVVLTVDTLRWDHVGVYAPGRSTPTLDAIANAGTRFERAYATAPVTLPSHASIFTGLYPFHHGVRANGFYRLGEATETLAERLKKAGYATAAFVSGFPLESRFGLAQGFDVYDDDFTVVESTGNAYEQERRAAETVASAKAWLATAREPFLLWVHLYDPHAEYEPPEPYRSRHAASLYDGEIAYADDQLGVLWKRLQPRLPRTLVVVAADHGESLGEHGERTHTIFVYDATIRVPLVIAGAGTKAGLVVKEPVSLVDVTPTILDVLGLPALVRADGTSLREATRGGAAPPADRPLYFESYVPQIEFGWSQLLGIQRGPLKYVKAPEVELYDVVKDPQQKDNLARSRKADTDAMARALWGLLGGDPVGKESPGELDAEAREKLRSLGYLQGGAEGQPLAAGDALPDPKAMISVQALVDGALRLLHRGRAEEAAASLRQVLAKDAGNPFASQALASALLQLGDADGALAALRGGLARAGRLTASALQTSAGDILRLRGELPEAERELRKALELNPENVLALERLGTTQLAAGKPEAAEASLQAALRLAPGNPRAVAALGDVALHRGKLPEARARYEEAARDVAARRRATLGLAVVAQRAGDAGAAARHVAAIVGDDAAVAITDRDVLQKAGTLAAELGDLELAVKSFQMAGKLAPRDAGLRRDLGVALSRLGRTDEAVSALLEARKLAPDDAAIANALGTAYARASRFPEAIAAFEEALRIDPASEMARQNLEAARAACPPPCGPPGR